MEEIEKKVRKIEDEILRVKTIFGFMSVLGIGIGAIAAILWTNSAEIFTQISTAEANVAQLETRVANADKLISEGIQKAVNEDGLITSFDSHAVLAQIQAQAICTAIAPRNTSVMAIFRRPIDTNAGGHPVAEKCTDICPRQTLIGSGKIGVSIGAVHIYGSLLPFKQQQDDSTSKGMATFVYSAPADHEQFGPNYCCCAG